MLMIDVIDWWEGQLAHAKEMNINTIDVDGSILHLIPKGQYSHCEQILFISEMCHNTAYRLWIKKPTRMEMLMFNWQEKLFLFLLATALIVPVAIKLLTNTH